MREDIADPRGGYSASEHLPDEDRLRALLVGKSVVRAEVRDEAPERWSAGPTGYLTLSDGTVLKVWGNTGGCSCGAGDYSIENLATCENVITNVKVEECPDGDWKCDECGQWSCEHRGFYRIFVWAEEERVNLASFEGSDGNGYYGTGWWLAVKPSDNGSSSAAPEAPRDVLPDGVAHSWSVDATPERSPGPTLHRGER